MCIPLFLNISYYESVNFFLDDNDDEDSLKVLNELEKIDDDCDRHGIQFVKIEDPQAALSFGLKSVPAVVYFEKQIPNIYDGDIEDEDALLHWLIDQLQKDEIEDITNEMMDRLIKEGKNIAVLFCMYLTIEMRLCVINIPN